MPAPRRRRLLILGGTQEARELAALAVERFWERLTVTTSLAGRTTRAEPIAGRVRRGGFGGAEGLARHLRRARVDLMIDATHPFAATISANARAAAAAAAVPCLRLARPPWQPEPGDRWIEVDDLKGAADALERLGPRVWLTIGSNAGGRMADFSGLRDRWFLVRLIEAPAERLPLAAYELVVARGPFTLEDEIDLIRRHRLDVLVTKASGGAATQAKLTAARRAGIPVVMIRRPSEPAEAGVPSVAAAAAWIVARLDERTPLVARMTRNRERAEP